ncbi:MAG: hypothetical protein VKN13_04570 [Cyanobacteriota bacterium]|nr:hypothetical protein [Cyanobacteriota bacterium]
MFHLSPQFRAIEIETRDVWPHPVLGGVSSTRVNAYNQFEAAHPQLVGRLALQPTRPVLNQLVVQAGQGIGPTPTLGIRVQPVVGQDGRLDQSGLLSGDGRSNRLVGSSQADVLLGWGGIDRLVGGAGADLLSGGAGADRFIYGSSMASPVGAGQRDTITDFQGAAGDRIQWQGYRRFIGAAPFHGLAGEVRFSSGLLQADGNGDRVADLEIALLGVERLQPGWVLPLG